MADKFLFMLNDKYRLAHDQRQWIVQRRSGKEAWYGIAFVGSKKAALMRIFKKNKIRLTDKALAEVDALPETFLRFDLAAVVVVNLGAAPIAECFSEGPAQGFARERLSNMVPVTFGGLEEGPLKVPELDVGLFGHVQRPVEQRSVTAGPPFAEPGLVDEIAAIVTGAFDAVISNEPLGCVHAPILPAVFA